MPGFGLELRPYQKRTLKWLVDLESDASQRTFMSLKDPSRRYAFESHGIPRELKSLVSLPGETPDAPCRTYLQFGPGGVYLDLPTMRVWTEKPTLNPHLLQEVKCHGAILA